MGTADMFAKRIRNAIRIAKTCTIPRISVNLSGLHEGSDI